METLSAVPSPNTLTVIDFSSGSLDGMSNESLYPIWLEGENLIFNVHESLNLALLPEQLSVIISNGGSRGLTWAI